MMIDEQSMMLLISGDKVSLGQEAAWDYKIKSVVDASMNKYLACMDETEQKVNYLLNEAIIPSKKRQDTKAKSIINVNIDKAKAAIDSMAENEDIRMQIQCVTRVIRQLDILYKSNNVNSNKRKVIALFRSVLKLNCDNNLFSDQQIEEFRRILELLRGNESELNNLVVVIEKELRKVGLRTMVAWE